MKNNAEQILDTVVWIASQNDDVDLEQAPVLELAKKLSASPVWSSQSRTVLRELHTPWRRRPAASSHRKKNAA